jgi:imidazoleglycerol phosphate dehydratase HisB
MKNRSAVQKRTTKETNISISLNLEKPGKVSIDTTLPFMDHMLNLFAHHAGFSLTIKAKGDTHIDDHHLVEDIGITLGAAIKIALGDKKGITRYGNFLLPMDEALSYVALDISGRPLLDFGVKFSKQCGERFDYSLLKEFFYALAINSGITLHISMKKGSNNHHIAEAVFKGFGRAISMAVARDAKNKKIPSTKGLLA